MAEEMVDVEEVVVVAVDLSLRNNAQQRTNKFALASLNKAVGQSQGKNVPQHQDSNVALYQNNNADQYQNK